MEKSCFKGKKAVFLGDSITYGQAGITDYDRVYHQTLKRSLELCEVVNYGINGSRIAHQEEAQNGGAMCRRFATMDDDADIVVLFGGVNDFGHGTAPFGQFSDRCEDTFYGACHVLMSGLVKKYTDRTVVIMTPCHCMAEVTPEREKNAVTGKRLSEYVEAIKQVAAYYAIPVLDLYSASGIVPYVEENRVLYAPDGLHPNELGQELIAQRLEGFLITL